jgi:hypothetical protein
MEATYKFQNKSTRRIITVKAASLEAACRKLGISPGEWNPVGRGEETPQGTDDSRHPEGCLTCGGSVYLDDGEPKCLMCGGNPRVKRSLPRSANRLFSEKIDDSGVDAGAFRGRKDRPGKSGRRGDV